MATNGNGFGDGKKGVDGSSPSEGSAKTPHVGVFAFRSTCRVTSVRWVWSRLWSSEVQNAAAGAIYGLEDSRSRATSRRTVPQAVRRLVARRAEPLAVQREQPRNQREPTAEGRAIVVGDP